MTFTEILKSLPGDIYRLFYPPTCPVCGRGMPAGAGFMCISCRNEIPLTYYWEKADNPVREKVAGLLPVVQASAFFHYIPGSPFRGLVHRFKYSGGWKAARDMGEWFGDSLAASGLYNDIDLMVPVPLHRRKLYKRGYNQSEYIAEGLTRRLGASVCTRNLVRTRHSRSQTTVDGSRRWDNVHGAFRVKDPGSLKGKHILLVDDVLTTGATIAACGEELIRSVEDIRLSIVALGATE